ncbi:PREDICTED: UPF0184 protein CG14818 isoform X1 [Rhagoletis zephyria]|uniref:UPF0184 protein CG14818 isoform X1 n=1 Tax=Rhagoletis zephyria TaxID=28612 RepID=UPI000811648D|nr:PREDICTED: UPF0184 protein CG14818 isoform X1 [Rhagoletis zephyria]XP_036319514.1 UPF0184 protein CG14818 isoform X1 [Rhagoletis pomonella]
MTPKNIDDPVDANSSTKADESDLQEVEDVNESLDELTRALDFFEQRTDDIIAQLKVLLDSNREIRQQIAQDKEKDTIAALAAVNLINKAENVIADEKTNTAD